MLCPPPLFLRYASFVVFFFFFFFVSGAPKSYDLTTQCPSIFKAGEETEVMCTIHSDTLLTSCRGSNPSLIQFHLSVNGVILPICHPEGGVYAPPECPPPADECNCGCKSASGNELTYFLKYRFTEKYDGSKLWCTASCFGGIPSIGPRCNISVGK